jgi:bifunctional non-homologous end joining protein LigD
MHLTNQAKVYWTAEGITKGELIEYYRDVAPMILHYLRDRPQSLHRHPNGIGGASFFQKDVSRQPPPVVVETVEIDSEGERKKIMAPLCQNEDSLLYLANLGCIEINPWNSRIQQLDRPDFLIIDLDPENAPFEQVVKAALVVRAILEEAGAVSYCKTSGKRGLHIYVPLGAAYGYSEARQFAQIVARLVHSRLPDFTSVERSPAKRQKRVYLDFLQNSRGQTLASAYSVRPFPGATVSTPLKWSEVTRRLDPKRFTIKTTRRRVEKVGDLWEPVLGKGIDIKACLSRLLH